MNFREAGREAQGGAAVATQQAVVAPEDAPSPAAPEQVQAICRARQQRCGLSESLYMEGVTLHYSAGWLCVSCFRLVQSYLCVLACRVCSTGSRTGTQWR